jgi:predicted RNA methylase
MNNFKLISEIQKHSSQLLECGDDFFVMKNSADKLYQIFSEITGIYFENNQDDHIELGTGRALSPSTAAHCLVEFKRTAIFLRGIKKAIDWKIANVNLPVEILYAGSGPYATLITPLLALFTDDQVKITLLDINEVSLEAVKTLILKLRLEKYIDEYVLADATKYQFNKAYDIVISETMQACLENEPQVHIMNNLIPQMKSDAIFVPEEINLDFYLSDRNLFNERILAKNIGKNIEYKIFVDHFIKLNKHTLNSIGSKKILKIPEYPSNYKELILDTFITVFEYEKLKERECSLNCSRQFYDLTVQKIDKVEFYLDYESKPKIRCKVLSP